MSTAAQDSKPAAGGKPAPDAPWEQFKSRVLRALPHDKKTGDITDSNELRLGNLIESVKRMALYAAETGQLPKSIDLGFVYQQWNKKFGEGDSKNRKLDEKDIDKLASYYSILELTLGNVTATSLKATACLGLKDCMKNEAGRYVQWQRNYAILLILVLAAIHIFTYWFNNYSLRFAGELPPSAQTADIMLDVLHKFSQYLEPFLYGTLGAFAYILRTTESRIRRREFDPRRVPGNTIRILLGSLSGGAIVLFFQGQFEQLDLTVAITTAALGFLAGYNTDLLFSTMDKMTKAITPPVEEPPPQDLINKTEVIKAMEEKLKAHEADSTAGKAKAPPPPAPQGGP